SVDEEPLERALGDLAADGVEARDDDRLGGVVDDQVDAGELFEGADVPALAADDPPLHVVAGERYDRHAVLGRMFGGITLEGHGDDVPSPVVSPLAGLDLELAALPAGDVAHLVLGALEGLVLRLEDDLLLLGTRLDDQAFGVSPRFGLAPQCELATRDHGDHGSEDETHDEGEQAHDDRVGHTKSPFRAAYAGPLA